MEWNANLVALLAVRRLSSLTACSVVAEKPSWKSLRWVAQRDTWLDMGKLSSESGDTRPFSVKKNTGLSEVMKAGYRSKVRNLQVMLLRRGRT